MLTDVPTRPPKYNPFPAKAATPEVLFVLILVFVTSQLYKIQLSASPTIAPPLIPPSVINVITLLIADTKR